MHFLKFLGHSHCDSNNYKLVYDADADFDLELLNGGTNPDIKWVSDFGDFSFGMDSSVSGRPVCMSPEYFGPPSGPEYMGPSFESTTGYMESSAGPQGFRQSPLSPRRAGGEVSGFRGRAKKTLAGPELQYMGRYYSNMMIPNNPRMLMENNSNNNIAELLPRKMDLRFPQTTVDDNFSMTNGNIAMVGVKS